MLVRGMLANRPNSRLTTSRREAVRCPRIVVSSANGGSRGAHIDAACYGYWGQSTSTQRASLFHTLGATAPHARLVQTVLTGQRASAPSPPFSFAVIALTARPGGDDWVQSAGAAPAPKDGHERDIERACVLAGYAYPRRRRLAS